MRDVRCKNGSACGVASGGAAHLERLEIAVNELAEVALQYRNDESLEDHGCRAPTARAATSLRRRP